MALAAALAAGVPVERAGGTRPLETALAAQPGASVPTTPAPATN